MNKIKKYLISYLGLLSFLAIGLFPNYSFADLINPFESGTGSENDPFIIMTCDQLQEINYHDVEGEISYPYLTGNYYFKLGDNIDCSVTTTWNETSEGSGEYYGFMPIGGTYDTAGEGHGANFIGNFDGNNKAISNLYISRPTFNGVGLFGYVNEINIQNLTLTDLNISGQDQTGGAIGSVTSSSLLNISTSGQVAGVNNVGGLVGRTSDTHIENSSSSSEVTGEDNVGGLVGQNNAELPQTILNSFSSSNVTGINNVGGLVGENNGDTITSSYATGNVSFDFDYLEDVVESYGSGGFDSISIPFNFGGLIGSNNNGHIEDSYATGGVSGITNVGGLVGGNIFMEESSTIASSYATGSVLGLGISGGLVGYNIGDTIEDSYATGDVSFNTIIRDEIISIATSLEIDVEDHLFVGDYNVFGGLVGINEGGHIENTYAEGNVEGPIAGGLVGKSVGGRTPFTITNSHATGTVTSDGFAAGGLVGVNMGDTITNSYATGDVVGNYESVSEVAFGGLVGVNMSGHIENTYALGNVEGIITGGLVGANMSSNPFRRTIINSYSSGNTEGSIVGGLVGMNMGDQIYNSYFVGNVIGVGSEAFEMLFGVEGVGDYMAGGFIGAIMIGEGDVIEDWVFNSGWNKKDNQDLSSIAFVQYETAENPIVELNVSSSHILEITDLSSLYTKDHSIYNSGDETQWQWNGNPWYESNTYPLFEKTTIRRPSSRTSSGSVASRITTPVVIPEPTEEQIVCLPGHIFNPLTGQRCQELQLNRPNDCQTGFSFSPSTGQPCQTTSNQTNSGNGESLNIQRTLREGMSGEDVVLLQTYLNSRGYDSGTPDGKFGPKTKQAVISFQIANQLVGDGIVGPKTIGVMK